MINKAETIMHVTWMTNPILRTLSVPGVSGWLELIGASLVVYGCGGEWLLLLSRGSERISPERKTSRLKAVFKRTIRPLKETVILFCIRHDCTRRAFFSTSTPSEEHRREKQYAILVAIGVGMELFAIPFSLRESSKVARDAANANERANKLELARVGLEKQVEELHRANLKLEAEIQPRRITAEQKSILVRQLGDLPNKCKVRVVAQSTDIEARVFMLQIRDTLRACGFETDSAAEFSVSSSDSERVDFGLSFAAKGPRIPLCVESIRFAFITARVIRVPPRPALRLDPTIKDDALEIIVGAKPLE